MASSTKKKKVNLKMIFAFLINVMLFGTSGLFVYRLLQLKGIENVLRIVFSIVYSIIIFLIIISNFKSSKKRKKVKYVFLILLSIILIGMNGFGYFNINKVLNTLNKVSNNKEVVSISLVTLKESNLKINDIKKDEKIGSISNDISESSNEVIGEFKNKNRLRNELELFDNYYDLMDALLDGKVRYIFLPTEYESIYAQQEKYEDVPEKVVILGSYSKTKEQETKEQKKVTEPFTILLMGVDTLTSTYNADTLLVVTFNPNTLSATMLSVPRDTYTTIPCTGRKHKINSSGWSGDKCVVRTLSQYVGVDIDYYAKINFKGIVEMVDLLGGVEVDVPYTFCEQNSKRRFGSSTIYVEKGLKTLNGEQALALTRNRHYWPNKCEKKYTTDGVRNDFVRGQNQQLVLKALLNKLKSVDSIETIYKIMDSLGNNMTTDMSTDTMLSLYNVGKDILFKINADDRDVSRIINIQKLKFTSYTKTIKIGNLNLSTVINYPESVNKVSDAMKVNLGLKEAKVIKTFEFDVNKTYEENIIGTKTYGGVVDIDEPSSKKVPNFVGKQYSEVEDWAKANDIVLRTEYREVTDSKYKNGEVVEQSINPDTDISKIKSIRIVVASKKSSETTSFGYKDCLKESDKSNDLCMIKNYVGYDVSVFKKWIAQTGLNIPVEYTEVPGGTKKIVGQNISGVSIYDVINENRTIEITYSSGEKPNEEPESNNENNNNNDNNGDNNSEDTN